jgi:hypothetical protein
MKVSKILKTASILGTLPAVAYISESSVILSTTQVVNCIKTTNYVPYNLIPRTKSVLISHENLLKLLDSGKIPQKIVNLISKDLFNISVNQNPNYKYKI